MPSARVRSVIAATVLIAGFVATSPAAAETPPRMAPASWLSAVLTALGFGATVDISPTSESHEAAKEKDGEVATPSDGGGGTPPLDPSTPVLDPSG